MPQIASWGKHKFVVSPSLIQSFQDLSIKGSTETTDKTANNQKYVERKAGEAAQVSFTVNLNALTGVKDVYAEAQQYITESMEGKTEYLYMGPSKIIPAKLMLTQAEVTEVVFAPGKGNVWISCNVKLTMKQGTPNEGNKPATPTGTGGGYTAKVYYSTGSGVVRSITVTSKVSYADALKKAYAQVPKNALWAGTTPQKASNPGAGTGKPGEDAKKRAAEYIAQHGKEASQDKMPEGTELMDQNTKK